MIKQVSYNGKNDFYEALPDKLTLNFNPGIFPSMNETNQTMFKEVTRDDYVQPEHIRKLHSELEVCGKSMAGTGYWTQSVFETVCNVIEKLWEKGKLHVFGASSGFDSRVMVTIYCTKNNEEAIKEFLTKAFNFTHENYENYEN